MAKKPDPKQEPKDDGDDAPCYEVGDTYCCSVCDMEVTIAKACEDQPDEPCLECCNAPMTKK